MPLIRGGIERYPLSGGRRTYQGRTEEYFLFSPHFVRVGADVKYSPIAPLCKVGADVVNTLSFAPLRKGGADEVNTLSFAPLRKGGADEVSRGVDSIRLIYTKTNK